MSNNPNPTKILIIDDEEIIRQSFADYFEDQGYDIFTAKNGIVGLEIVMREHPDLILTDLRMPEMDGLEVIERSRQLVPDTPIIIVSGTGRIGDAVEAMRLGAWDYILKPVEDWLVLEHQINKAQEKARLIRENKMYQARLEHMVKERTAELEQVNARLSASEELYRTLFEKSGDAIFLIDEMTGQYINANQAAERLTGYSLSEIKTKTTKDLTPYGAAERLKLVNANETAHNFGEVTYVRSDGTERTTLLTAFSLQNRDMMVGIAHDITERNLADEALRQLNQAMEQSPVTVMITDTEGIIQYVNPKFSQISGYSAAEAIGQHSHMVAIGRTAAGILSGIMGYHYLRKRVAR